jgi:hypothetical protein
MNSQTIKEHEGVALLHDLPESKLVAGDTGVVVYVHAEGAAYEVEFANPAGTPRFIVVTVEAKDLLRLQARTRLRDAI